MANEILVQAKKAGTPVSHLPLQKVCFFTHGIYMASRGGELIRGEFEAWKFGPVHRVLFHALQAHRDRPIDALIARVDPISAEKKSIPRITSREDAEFVMETSSLFLKFTAGQLIELSHAPGTPWSNVWERASSVPNIGMKISNDLVRSYYQKSELKN